MCCLDLRGICVIDAKCLCISTDCSSFLDNRIKCWICSCELIILPRVRVRVDIVRNLIKHRVDLNKVVNINSCSSEGLLLRWLDDICVKRLIVELLASLRVPAVREEVDVLRLAVDNRVKECRDACVWVFVIFSKGSCESFDWLKADLVAFCWVHVHLVDDKADLLEVVSLEAEDAIVICECVDRWEVRVSFERDCVWKVVIAVRVVPSIAAVSYRELILCSIAEVDTEVRSITDFCDFLIVVVICVLEVVLLELSIEVIDIWRRLGGKCKVRSDLSADVDVRYVRQHASDLNRL